jgi:hypothetical protein
MVVLLAYLNVPRLSSQIGIQDDMRHDIPAFDDSRSEFNFPAWNVNSYVRFIGFNVWRR